MPNDKPSAAEKVGTLLTTEELAQQLKVKPSYLDWLRHRHDLPWVRVGGEVRYDTTAVRAWLQQRAAGAPKSDDLAVVGLRPRLKEKVDFAQWDALHKHIIALACYRGTDGEDLLEQAFKDVANPACWLCLPLLGR